MLQDHDLISVRDLAGNAERMAELLHADARNGLDFTVARAAEEESRRTYQMAVSAHRLNLSGSDLLSAGHDQLALKYEAQSRPG